MRGCVGVHDEVLTELVKLKAVELGADMVAIAPVKRYEHAPEMMRPQSLLPNARSVIVIAVHHPDACVELGGEPTPHDVGPYNIQGSMNSLLDHISFWLGRFIESIGYEAMPLTATNIWRYRKYKSNETEFAPDLSNIHAAVASGLGEFGRSGLLLTPEFGPRQRLCCVVTSAPLKPDELYKGVPLCDGCNMCVEACPMDTFTKEAGEAVVRIGEKEFKYIAKNKWRCAWAEHFGLSVDLPKPETIDEGVILRMLDEHGVRGGAMGYCLRFCMPPHLRYRDEAYTRVWRRKRIGIGQVQDSSVRNLHLLLQVKNIAFNAGVNWVSVADARRCEERGINLRDYLPDAQSLLMLTMRLPKSFMDDDGKPDAFALHATSMLMDWVELNIARMLERFGYSALAKCGISAEHAAIATGLAERGDFANLHSTAQASRCIITSAPLPSGCWVADRSIIWKTAVKHDITEELIGFSRSRGADLVGIVDAETVNELADVVRQLVDERKLGEYVRDVGRIHGCVVPQIVRTDSKVMGANDWLDGARSVIVLGLHYCEANLRYAMMPPSEAVGPYAFASYQAVNELLLIALDVAFWLEAKGYRARIATDLLGIGIPTLSPRGFLPDANANALIGALAGIGWVGWHGALLTKQYGVAQRLICVITDAELKPSKPLEERSPCDFCERPCVIACPTGALSNEPVSIALLRTRPNDANEIVWRMGKLSRRRCECAKRYGLVGEEGPAFMGDLTRVTLPDGEPSVDEVAEMMRHKDPIQKHWICIVERCLHACHNEGAWKTR
jgi:epoxyqueuosine reductase QueG